MKFTYAQSIITGTVKDEKNNALENINILVQPKHKNGIIAFGISNTDGFFSIKVASLLDSLLIKTNSINYAEKIVHIPNQTQNIKFSLIPQAMNIAEVVIKAPAITQRNDTISYLVSSFADKKDIVIGDVLKKMPGIEVESDGKIFYQGKPIEKFYIEGLDLLEGKYNIANNNLPYESVSSVEILENHQSKKILEGLMTTERTSLNIKLKNKIATIGTAKLGSGFTPLLWEANFTPMLFTKNQQMINSYQANNVGNDVSMDLKTLTIEDMIDMVENDNEKKDFVSIQKLATPDFEKNRYLNNNIHLLTINDLIKLKKDYILRTNVFYLNDYQKQEGDIHSKYYLVNDTITSFESTHNKYYFNSLQTDITLTKNSKNKYLKNTFMVNSYWDSQNGAIENGQSEIVQKVNNPNYSFTDKLKIIQPVGNQLIEISSFLNYSETPQCLYIAPGQFNDIINSQIVYDGIKQMVNHYSFNTNNSIGITKVKNRWTITTKLGFQYEAEKLNTNIFKVDSGTEVELKENFQNRLDRLALKYYSKLDIQYNTNRFKIEASIPLYYIKFDINDNALQQKQSIKRFLTDPRFTISYNVNAKLKLYAIYNYKNKFGEINQLNYGYILNTYRNLQIKNAPLSEKVSQFYSFNVSYRNPLKSFFSSMAYSTTLIDDNILYFNDIQDNGSLVLSAINYKNRHYMYNTYIQASKYYSEIKTTFFLKLNYSVNQKKFVLNENIENIENNIFGFNAKLSNNIFSWLSLNYNYNLNSYKTQIGENEQIKNVQHKHKIDLFLYPVKNHSLGFTAENYYNQFFIDCFYNFTIPKRKIKIEVKWYNILNNSTFSYIDISSYSIIQSTYYLRPSQLMLTVKFTF